MAGTIDVPSELAALLDLVTATVAEVDAEPERTWIDVAPPPVFPQGGPIVVVFAQRSAQPAKPGGPIEWVFTAQWWICCPGITETAGGGGAVTFDHQGRSDAAARIYTTQAAVARTLGEAWCARESPRRWQPGPMGTLGPSGGRAGAQWTVTTAG